MHDICIRFDVQSPFQRYMGTESDEEGPDMSSDGAKTVRSLSETTMMSQLRIDPSRTGVCLQRFTLALPLVR